MEIKSKFDHFNINVTNLERSIAFYEKALGLKEHHRKEASDGSFTLVYLTDNETGFLLELTWLKDHTAPYELGENESHLCFRVAGDYEAIMGGIVFKGKKDKPKEEEKVKTKAKKATYIRGQHGSGAAKMKADIRKKRASRHKK